MRQYYPILNGWITILLCLVILGHCRFPGAPLWYDAFYSAIYSFHMAAFFFVCGFLIQNAYQEINTLYDYFAFLKKKLIKFGIPYLCFGIGLCAYAIFVIRGGSWVDFLKAIRGLVLYPSSSLVIYLWFIYLLFEFYCLAPLFCQCTSKIVFWGYLLVALFLYFHPLTRLFCLNQFSRYLLFFLLGILCRKEISIFSAIPQWIGWMAFPIFFWSLMALNVKMTIVSSLLSLPVLFVLSGYLVKFQWGERLSHYLAQRCFAIYLWQMIFLHLWARVALYKFVLPYWILLAGAVPVAIVGALTTDFGCKFLGMSFIKR